MNWETKTIGECVKMLSGGTPKKSREDYWGGNIPWVSSGEMTESFLVDTSLHVTSEGAANGTRLVPENTVLAVVRGMSLAKEFRVSITKRAMTFNQDIKAFECVEGIDPRFLFYALKARKEYIRDLSTDASHGTKKLDTEPLKAVKLLVPETIEEQRAIADVVACYDDLIENNRRRIALLEEAARLLYREWFVHFRFPGHEHVKIIDGVPEGWEIKKVGDLLARVKAKIKVRKDEYLEDGDYPCVDQGQKFIGGYTDNPETIYRDELPLIVFGDHTRALKFVDFPFARGADGTQICQSNDERLSQEMFYWALVNVDLSNYFYARHFKFLKDQEIIIPSQPLADNFTLFSRDNFRQIKALRQQCAELEKARDLLLPRLMDGRLEV